MWKSDSPKEMFSLPFQQTARYVKEYGDEISEEEREIIAKVLDYDSLAEIYEPMTADPVKTTYRSGSAGDLTAYFKVWLKEFFRHPLCYVEATWNQNYYVFAPYVDNVVYNKNCLVGSELEYDKEYYSWLNFQIPEKMEGLANVTVKLYSLLTTAPVIGMFSNVAFYVILMFVLLHFIRLEKIKSILRNASCGDFVFVCVVGTANSGAAQVRVSDHLYDAVNDCVLSEDWKSMIAACRTAYRTTALSDVAE